MYKGTYNENGEYTGFYVEGIHENIPEPNIDLTEEEWQQALSKDYKVIEGKHIHFPFVQSPEELLENIRATRNTLLIESDWTQMEDSPLTETKKLEWKIYRQELRDLTETDNPEFVVWPSKPL
ncbi:tail fiber assembly protein [Flavobacterium phragmitis]|uniref:Phage tail assembly chaperone protein n=1 Tax=Flavobacterium phragmitis TaxID=739143 RepID=A0A1I1WGK7_9FLAO|nr:tail fiber assembly protein [Flavobacterium phragmitis]SFD94277.1 Phage tail assembly chaperone protein [Flavobacterium phragmitis]